MISRSSPAPWGRLVFGLLFVFAVIAPICLFVLVWRAQFDDVLNLFRIWSAATALLLIWAAIYIEEEPRLARAVLGLSVLVFAFIALRAGFYPGSETALPAAAQTSQSAESVQSPQTSESTQTAKVAEVPKSDKIEDAIVGKWQLDGTETTVFSKDKTFVINTDDGHTLFGRYFFLEPNSLQYFFFNGDSDKPFLWSDLTIKGDTMTRKGLTKILTYRRLETNEDSVGVTGLWITREAMPFIFFADKTFVFGRSDVGTWKMNGRQLVARSNNPKGSTWTYSLSSDGLSLSGPWSSPNGDKGDSTLTRPKFDKLEDYIIGRWQMAGHTQTLEYKRDGTLVITGDDGGAKTFNYSVADANHIQTALPNTPFKLPVWTVEMVNENVMTSATSAKGQRATYVRLY